MSSIFISRIQNTMAQRGLLFKLNELGGPTTMNEVGELMKAYFNEFVPMRTGKLRKSCRYRVSPWRVDLSWGNTGKTGEYVNYQYNGIVYEKNYPVVKDGVFKGWYSKKGVAKTPTTRELGVQQTIAVKYGKTYYLTKLGYRTPGTSHHWVEVGKADPRYNRFRQDVTRYMKRRIKELENEP